jgi:hypothetical protein
MRPCMVKMLTAFAIAWLVAVCATAVSSAQSMTPVAIRMAMPPAPGLIQIHAEPPDNSEGRHLNVWWLRAQPRPGAKVILLRRESLVGEPVVPLRLNTLAGLPQGPQSGLALEFLLNRIMKPAVEPSVAIEYGGDPVAVGDRLRVWTVVAITDGDIKQASPIVDEVRENQSYVYAALEAIPAGKPDCFGEFAEAAYTVVASPKAAIFNWTKLGYLCLILLTGASLFGFTWLAKRRTMFVRRIAGVDAIEDAVGRSTEMGRPVLYVTGVEEAQDIQTIAGLLILGHVAKITAEYDTEIRVANAFPLTMVVAEEMVRQGYANAGRLDAHKPENVMFITSEQFAFAAGVNGMILRERPATNIYFGRFYAESLMLAETGFLTGAVQIAGTCELTQMPFFIAGCDYTLIGEELYATSAYLSREPDQLAQLKTGDLLKVVIALLVVTGVLFATLGTNLMGVLFP